MLTLPIKKKWFDMIKSGEKKEEYREITKYYGSRFGKLGVGDGIIKEIILRNGYSKNSPSIKCQVLINIHEGKVEWGAEPNKNYFVLEILSVKEI